MPERVNMLLGTLDFGFREAVILAIFAWLYYRHTWVMIAVTLMALGLVIIMILPADLYYSLPPLALSGFGLGMLFYHYQLRQITLRREAKTPRTYHRKQDGLKS
ncbi:hypothetical protein SC127_18335 [Pantoea sp. T14]|uniref:hypothetical protein n=1 Tax=Pantoea TaxID=53335 RepID=UPI00208FD738|nr:hypothetical protein [Pantoea bituminis]